VLALFVLLEPLSPDEPDVVEPEPEEPEPEPEEPDSEDDEDEELSPLLFDELSDPLFEAGLVLDVELRLSFR